MRRSRWAAEPRSSTVSELRGAHRDPLVLCIVSAAESARRRRRDRRSGIGRLGYQRVGHNRNTFQFCPARRVRASGTSIRRLERRTARAHRTAVLPQQAALRRPGHLHPAPQPRARRPRAHASRSSPGSPTPTSTRASTLTKVPEPRPLPRAGPVPDAEAPRVPRPRRRRGVRDHVRRPASPSRRRSARGSPGCCATGSTTSTSSTTTRCSATACSTSRRWACR